MERISIASRSDSLIIGSDDLPLEQFVIPPPEMNVFDRHRKLPGHDQERLRLAHLLLVGVGGLGCPIGVECARSGIGEVTANDYDDVEPPNLSRQLFGIHDVGQPKATAFARQLVQHFAGGGKVTGIALAFQDLIERDLLPRPVDVVSCGVDNNACRKSVAQWARRHRIPAIFTSLSNDDGQRCVCFLQGPSKEDPCLWCANPELDPEGVAPCDAAAIITGCFLASSFAVFFIHRALMGWPKGVEPFNWREADLLGHMPEVIGRIQKRPDCPVCRDL